MSMSGEASGPQSKDPIQFFDKETPNESQSRPAWVQERGPVGEGFVDQPVAGGEVPADPEPRPDGDPAPSFDTVTVNPEYGDPVDQGDGSFDAAPAQPINPGPADMTDEDRKELTEEQEGIEIETPEADGDVDAAADDDAKEEKPAAPAGDLPKL